MTWTLCKTWFHHTLYGMDAAPAAVIRRQRGRTRIADAAGRQLLWMESSGPLTLTVAGEGEREEARLRLAETAPATLPPRVQALSLSWAGEAWELRQSSQREFDILREGTPAGRLTGILGARASLSLEEPPRPGLAALLCALALEMLHAEDIAIV